jgi:hypothetical protein
MGENEDRRGRTGGQGGVAGLGNARRVDCRRAEEPTASRLLWHGLPLSAGDAIRAHWYDKDLWPNAPTPLECFALGPTALLVAQSWAIPDTPYLPSARWWKRLRRLSDRGLARVARRVAGLVGSDVLDRRWKRAWRASLLPGLLEEVRRRKRHRRRARTPAQHIDVLEVSRRLTGETGRLWRGEWWFHCPFHEDRTPSYHVNAEKQVWHCFGCQRGGGWKALEELAA